MELTRASAPVRAQSAPWALLRSLRPHQWIKNTLIFSGLVFSRSLPQSEALLATIAAFLLFCAASSAIYLLNDLRDIETDRLHPAKRLRPLAAGEIGISAAWAMFACLLAASVAGAMLLRPAFAVLLIIYLLLNVSYSFGLKRVVILDVMLVAAGFVLRAAAGAAVIDVHPTPWLILCTLLLALMVSFGKRRQELAGLQASAGDHRATLGEYSLASLDTMVGISAAAAIVAYALYTVADQTVARFGSQDLLLTTPFVLFGVFRYIHLMHTAGEGDPARLFVGDLPTLINAGLWIVTVATIIYGPLRWNLL